ncbi:OB-fold protein [Collimonas sp.]|uniref:OB-fold protein n=1 Tax=Collimonas sp. TaxID=1963772 RepID=UPI002C45AF66|nr:hypothetical protein [Collimonas sp.]HWX02247.1 hypothetical protein [Collimonas sp.]
MGAAIGFISFVAVWWGLVRFYKSKGKGAFVRHLAGFAGGFVALIIVAAVAGGSSKTADAPAVAQNTDAATSSADAKSAAASSSKAQIPAEAAMAVTVLQLAKDYDANEVAADQKYKGKMLRVSGSVQSIDKDAFNNIVVHLKTANEYMPAMAKLNDKHEALAASLSKGNKVTWQCEGGGRIIGSPVLNNCAPA